MAVRHFLAAAGTCAPQREYTITRDALFCRKAQDTTTISGIRNRSHFSHEEALPPAGHLHVEDISRPSHGQRRPVRAATCCEMLASASAGQQFYIYFNAISPCRRQYHDAAMRTRLLHYDDSAADCYRSMMPAWPHVAHGLAGTPLPRLPRPKRPRSASTHRSLKDTVVHHIAAPT